eukprot:TRINITY_DN1782_c0_g1_i1.p1 TRINITY_DN1782_c0_g1~~TRINITY_DN1782_c0_g1_i1.p1  ORF type:complete len:571 (-),score=193.46 TRINITY_DN1782_c0_g1_i1:344-2056(-)
MDAARVTTTITVGAVLLLGFAVYRYSTVDRKKKRKDVSEPSVEAKASSDLTAIPSDVSVSITKNGISVDNKEEARRVIQKVLSETMSKSNTEKSVPSLEEDRESLASTSPSRSHSAESSRYVPFEEVLNRKSMERSPTPTKPAASLSPESRSYVHLSRDSSLSRETLSPAKESPPSPAFQLFKKAGSPDKEAKSETESASELATANIPSENGAPDSTGTHNNDDAVKTEEEISKPESNYPIKKPDEVEEIVQKEEKNKEESIPEEKTIDAVIDSTISDISSVYQSTLKEVKSMMQSIDAPPSKEDASSKVVVEEEEVQKSIPLTTAAVPSADLKEEEIIPAAAVPEPTESSDKDEKTEVQDEQEPSSIVSEEPSSFEIVDLKPRMLQTEEEEEAKDIDNDENTPSSQEKDDAPSDNMTPELNSLDSKGGDENSITPSVETVKKDDEPEEPMRRFRPTWASSKENGHAWEKGVAVPKVNGGDEEEMNLLSRSQEKEVPSGSSLLSDSDDDEASHAVVKQLPEAPASIMEDIREESEEPEETSKATADSGDKQAGGSKGNNAKRRRNNKKKS